MGTKAISLSQHSGLADSLFSRTQQRVLGLLFGQSNRSFFATEIIALAGAGSGAVQRELARLEQSGLVTARRIGRQKHYQANAASPVFAELRGLVLKSCGLADVLRAALAPLSARIQAAFVFGSLAKGQDTAASDIDLMLVSDSLGYPDVFAVLEEAGTRLGRAVNPTIYTPQELARRKEEGNAFVTRVWEQPKIWLIGEADDRAA